MPVTNAQIISFLTEMKKETHDRISQLEAKIDQLEKNVHSRINVNRNGIAGVRTTMAPLQQRVQNHQKNWDKVWKYGIGLVLTAVVLSILAAIGLKV